MTYKTSVIAEELIALRDDKGMIKPRDVVTWARRHPKSALHAQLEWDNDRAADAYRMQQVRELIAVHVIDAEGHRQMVSLSIDRTSGGGYRQVDDVLKVPSLREIMLNDALVDLQRLQVRYQHVTELIGVWNEAEKVRASTPRSRRKAA